VTLVFLAPHPLTPLCRIVSPAGSSLGTGRHLLMAQLGGRRRKREDVAPSRMTEVPGPDFITVKWMRGSKAQRLKGSSLDLSIGQGLGERHVSIRVATCSKEKGRNWPRVCSSLLFKSLPAPLGVIEAFHWGKNRLRETGNSWCAGWGCVERERQASASQVACHLVCG
jgi:hypothetical protein